MIEFYPGSFVFVCKCDGRVQFLRIEEDCQGYRTFIRDHESATRNNIVLDDVMSGGRMTMWSTPSMALLVSSSRIHCRIFTMVGVEKNQPVIKDLEIQSEVVLVKKVSGDIIAKKMSQYQNQAVEEEVQQLIYFTNCKPADVETFRRLVHMFNEDNCNSLCQVESMLSSLQRENPTPCWHESYGTKSMKMGDPLECMAKIRDYCSHNKIKSGNEGLMAVSDSGQVVDEFTVSLDDLRFSVKQAWTFVIKRLKMPYTFQQSCANAIIARVVDSAIMPTYLEDEEIKKIISQNGLELIKTNGFHSSVKVCSISSVKELMRTVDSINTRTIQLENGLHIFLC